MNLNYFEEIVTEINKCKTCSDLTNASTSANDKMSKLTADQAAALLVLEALMAAPTDLPSLLTWAVKITEQYVAPQLKMLQEKIATTSSDTSISSAISAKQISLGC